MPIDLTLNESPKGRFTRMFEQRCDELVALLRMEERLSRLGSELLVKNQTYLSSLLSIVDTENARNLWVSYNAHMQSFSEKRDAIASQMQLVRQRKRLVCSQMIAAMEIAMTMVRTDAERERIRKVIETLSSHVGDF